MEQGEYSQDRLRADKHAPQAIEILEEQYPKAGRFVVASAHLDCDSGTDLVSVGPTPTPPVKAAFRVRGYSYLVSFPFDFTVRVSRASGVVTEIEKIKAGAGDVMLFGWLDEVEARMIRWVLLSLPELRKAWESNPRLLEDAPLLSNDNGHTEFVALDLRQYSPAVVKKYSPGFWAVAGGRATGSKGRDVTLKQAKQPQRSEAMSILLRTAQAGRA